MQTIDFSEFRPLHDRILVKLTSQPKIRSQYIILPDIAQEKQRRGIVVAVGLGKINHKTGKRKPMTVKVGDDISFSMDDYDNDEFVLITEGDVLGIHSS